jgi:imidazolonepropionase-like amidohydrolase
VLEENDGDLTTASTRTAKSTARSSLCFLPPVMLILVFGGFGLVNVFRRTPAATEPGSLGCIIEGILMRKIAALLLFICQLSLPLYAQQQVIAEQNVLAMTHVTVIDVTGAPAKPDMTVIISGNRIIEIGKTQNIRIPQDALKIDATGQFLIPGLWDMHVHIGDEDFDKMAYLRLFIVNGVTGIRIMEGAPEHHLWRREIEDGTLLAPRMVIASRIIGQTRISEAEACEEVRKAKQEGADFIKVHDNLPRESYFALIDEAKRLNLLVEGHTPTSITAEEASQVGQKSIEHLTGLDEAKSDLNKAQALFRIFKKNHTWQCPTLIMRHNYALLNDSRLANDPRLKYVEPSWRKQWLKMVQEAETWPADEAVKRKELIRLEDNLVGEMQRAGVGILAGTDDANPFCFPGFSLHDELALLVEAGLTPMEALQTATLNPAKFFSQLDSLGAIEKGKLADLVLLDANPLEDIHNTKKINAVIANGRLLDRKTLDEILSQIETLANTN